MLLFEARSLNTNEHRSRSGLSERVIRHEATETEGLVLIESVMKISLSYIIYIISLTKKLF